jgi:Mor family transcriptional regulator
MSYRRAEDILPMDIIKLIQEYVDGENIYIPRKKNKRKEWGNNTTIKQELLARNQQIFSEYKEGLGISEIALKYFLSEKSIQRILREMKETT